MTLQKIQFVFLAAALICVLFTTACETIVDADIPESDPVLVVNSFFQPDNEWFVSLSRSTGILETDEFLPIENGSVQILDNGIPIATLTHETNGNYRASGILPFANRQYTLKASAPEFQEVTAVGMIPALVPLDSVSYGPIEEDQPFYNEQSLSIYFSDPATVNNYYGLLVLGQTSTGPTSEFSLIPYESSDPALPIENNNVDSEGGPRFTGFSAVFDDAVIDGEAHELDIRILLGESYPIVWVVLYSLSDTHYQYLKSADLQADTDDNPFAEPVLVFTNIEGGLGIFAGYNIAAHQVY